MQIAFLQRQKHTETSALKKFHTFRRRGCSPFTRKPTGAPAHAAVWSPTNGPALKVVLYGYSFTVLRKKLKTMKEKMLDRFKFPDELKEKLVMLVVYQNRLPIELSRQYGLPNAHILVNWVNIYKRSLEKGAITLPPMQTKKKKDTPALKQRIKQLEKSLEKANVMIYGLNAMIDYAEKELKVPVRKKHGTK